MNKEEKKVSKNTQGAAKVIKLNEAVREYIFPGKNSVIIEEAELCIVNNIGTHRVQNAKGEIYIVNRGWLTIRIIEK